MPRLRSKGAALAPATPTHASRPGDGSINNSLSQTSPCTAVGIASQLQGLVKDVARSHEDLCAYTIASAKATDWRTATGPDYFAELKSNPVASDAQNSCKIVYKVSRLARSPILSPALTTTAATRPKV